MDQINNAMGLVLMIWVVGGATVGFSMLSGSASLNYNSLARSPEERERVPGVRTSTHIPTNPGS
jgi:hypothetical protein